MPTKELLDWLRASRNSKSLKNIKRTTAAFSVIFARVAKQPVKQLVQRLRVVGRDLLRTGRVRLDIVRMLVCRDFLETVVKSDEGMPWMHIYCDASPQARGLELFAAS